MSDNAGTDASPTTGASPVRGVQRPAPYGRVLITGAVFGVLLAIICFVLYWILRLLGVPFEVQTPGSTGLTLVSSWQVVLTSIAAGVLGAAVAGLFRTVVSGPRLVAVLLGALTLASCSGPLVQPAEVTMSTRLSLVLFHLIVGGTLTWALSRAVTSEDPPPGVIEALDARHPGAGGTARR